MPFSWCHDRIRCRIGEYCTKSCSGGALCQARIEERSQAHEDFALNGDAFLPDGNMSLTPGWDAEQRTQVFFLVM